MDLGRQAWMLSVEKRENNRSRTAVLGRERNHYYGEADHERIAEMEGWHGS